MTAADPAVFCSLSQRRLRLIAYLVRELVDHRRYYIIHSVEVRLRRDRRR